MTEETKQFSIGDVLTITTGLMVSHDHIQGVYNILDWMTGEPLMTHQLVRASGIARPFLLETFPQLADIVNPTFLSNDKEAVFTWVDMQGELYGEWFAVPKLPEGYYESMNPIEEWAVAREKAKEE